MTKEEKKKILEDARDKAYSVLKAASSDEFLTGEVKNLLETISELDWMLDKDRVIMALDENPVPAPETPAPAPTAPETPEPEPGESKYSMTDVRAALAKARSKGINVADIIRSFGVENFQQIDASKYPAIMEKLEVATNAT